MTHNTDDPRLTAYVLGELDEAERAAVESHIAGCAACREFVELTRAIACRVGDELAKEGVPRLSLAQHRAIEQELQKRPAPAGGLPKAGKSTARRRWLAWAGVAAALLLVGLFVSVPGVVGMRRRSQAEKKRQEDQVRVLTIVKLPQSVAVIRATSSTEYYSNGIILATPGETIPPGFNTEAYDRIVDNSFQLVTENPLSTFSIDVDTASYANLRRFLSQGMLPPKDAVRIEELINYFSYDYPQPTGAAPFSTTLEIAGCPWNVKNRLIRIGLKGREVAPDKRPVTNLVFLLDVSGSMQPANKLPLVKQAMKLLVNNLTENDRLAIVVYAGAAGLVLPSTTCDRKDAILSALDGLQSGGCTQGSAGIQLAYETATANFIKGGCNRVVLCTDGDFNVGITNQGDLVRLIEEKAKSGVFLSVLGFGMGNLKDSTLEKLADKGNGNYAYIDTLKEAQKVLVEQMGGTLVTIAKDVKIQIEFNPVKVAAYRLIGYENRLLAKEDFNDDKKDAGEIGAGHTVTALYEIVPAGENVEIPGVDPLRYQRRPELTSVAGTGETMTLKLRYKEPDGDSSKLMEFRIADDGGSYSSASADFKFAASVAAFGMILRDSPYKGSATPAGVLELAEEGKGADRNGYRSEFLELVKQARALIRK